MSVRWNARQFSHHPLGRVFAGTRGDQPVRLALLTQKAEHRRQRRQADTAVAQARRVQPRLVELQTRRQQIGDALVQARDEQASDAGVIHTVNADATAECRPHSAVAHSALPAYSDMIFPVHDSLRAHVARVLTTLYALDESTLPTVALEYPPNRDARRPRNAGRLRARPAAAQGAARHRTGDRRRVRHARRRSRRCPRRPTDT